MRLLSEGQLIRDIYEVERFLGEGAFAEVYRVKHRFLGRQAMKVFKRVGMELSEIHDMLGEAIILSRINHPNIVRVFNADVLESKEGRCGFFTMEHIAGGTLDKFWRSYGGQFVPVETTVELIKQVCRGIELAHRESPPIIHRDIKPQNILVGYEPDGLRARVSDFGLAKQVNPLTLLATAAGTLAFKPPEAYTDYKGDSCAADVWGIGATLYLLLTDRLPFTVPMNVSWADKKLFDKLVVPPSEINPNVNRTLDEIVMQTLEKKMEDRIPSAKELLIELERWKPNAGETTKTISLSSKENPEIFLSLPAKERHEAPQELVQNAFKAKSAGRLNDAADIMEEAFNKSPEIRAKYANQVKLWRCGISM